MTFEDEDAAADFSESAPIGKRKHRVPAAPTWAAKALEQCGGDQESAARLLDRWWDEDPDVARVFRRFAIVQAINFSRRRMRVYNKIVHSPDSNDATPPGLVKLARSRIEESLLEMPLLGGLLLGDCTKEDLDFNIKRYGDQARGSIRMIKFLNLVGQAMGNAKHVRDALTHERLVKLQIETDRA